MDSGTVIDLVVTCPVAPSPVRFTWPASPEIEGSAVRFLSARTDLAPPGVDGGETAHHYELEAVAPGRATVVLTPVAASREPVGRSARLEITVKVRAIEIPALPELVLGLVETVAVSQETPLEIARRFGEVEADASSAAYVKPSDRRLSRVIVVRHPATRAPAAGVRPVANSDPPDD